MLRSIFKSHKVQAFLLYPLYFISRFLKRDANIWVFGPLNHSFLDNSKYLFLYMTKEHPEIKCVFITDNRESWSELRRKNLTCYYKWSFKAFYYGLKAKYYFISAYIDDINFWTSGNAVIFNLWHGIPLKKIEFDIDSGPFVDRYEKQKLYFKIFKPWLYRRPDFVLSTSETVSKLFASAFRIKSENCPALGYPRTDIFFLPPNEIKEYIKREEPSFLYDLCKSFETYRHVLLYMPTWRDDRSDFLQTAFPDIEALNSVLANQNALLLIKLHPNDSSFKMFKDLSNIKSLKAKGDLYPVLPFTTALITDYSSVYFDYMLLKKPIIFYPFDLENYQKLRGFYFDYREVVPGEIVNGFDELLKILSDLGNLKISKNYEKLLNMFWKYPDGGSSERIVRFVKALK
ncbi:MAG: hypothetical protein GXO77_10460 [Calditrichaeota bacterium]|nr:hypothetical protein [Calditrichota bacterium]